MSTPYNQKCLPQNCLNASNLNQVPLKRLIFAETKTNAEIIQLGLWGIVLFKITLHILLNFVLFSYSTRSHTFKDEDSRYHRNSTSKFTQFGTLRISPDVLCRHSVCIQGQTENQSLG